MPWRVWLLWVLRGSKFVIVATIATVAIVFVGVGSFVCSARCACLCWWSLLDRLLHTHPLLDQLLVSFQHYQQ